MAHNCRSCHALQICPSCRVRARKLWRALDTNACPVAKFEAQHVKRVRNVAACFCRGIWIICQSFYTCCCVCRFARLLASRFFSWKLGLPTNLTLGMSTEYMIAVQKPMKGFTASRSTGIDLPDMRERYLSRNVNIGERFAEDPRKTR